MILVLALAHIGSLLTPLTSVETGRANRIDVRDRLVALLPATASPPVFLGDELQTAVEALEELEHVPHTAEFLRLGTAGPWSVCAFSEPEHPDAERALQVRTAAIRVDGVEQEVDGDGAVRTSAAFTVDDDGTQLRGRYQVDASLSLTPMADSLDMRSSPERRLSLPRAPTSMEVAEMMQLLHGRLCTEFRADEGVRVGMQTTYLDDTLRITRCTKSGMLRGACTVYRRMA